MSIETILIIIIVTGAAVYAGRNLYMSSRAPDKSCHDGCEACPMYEKNGCTESHDTECGNTTGK